MEIDIWTNLQNSFFINKSKSKTKRINYIAQGIIINEEQKKTMECIKVLFIESNELNQLGKVQMTNIEKIKNKEQNEETEKEIKEDENKRSDLNKEIENKKQRKR